MPIDDRVKKSFELAQDVMKQLITLSTIVVTFTAAIFKDEIRHGTAGAGIMAALFISIASVAVGLLGLLTITGTFASTRIADAALSVNAPGVRLPATIQAVLFFAAIAALVIWN